MKYIYKNYFNLLIFLLFFFSYYLYFLSLERCFEGEDNCCKKSKWMKKKVIEESLSCFLTIILFQLLWKSKITKLHIIHFIIAFLLFYIYSHGIKFDDHGYYNIKFYFIIIIPISLLLFIAHYLLSHKNKKIAFLCFFSSLLIIYSIKIIVKRFLDCSDWPRGLNNTSIDNDRFKYGCLIQIPNFCPYKLGKYFLYKFHFTYLTCHDEALKSREKWLKFSKSPYIKKDTLRIGYPLINKEPKLYLLKNYDLLGKYISENLIDMDNLTLIKSLNGNIPEVTIDFSKNKIGQININLNFNKTLSDERKKLEKNTFPYSNNILIVYIDSVSRANSIRQLPKTLKFFEKFMSYKGNRNHNFPSHNFHSFQFFKYHSFTSYTPGNYPILFYGNHRNKMNKYITLYLKKNGFITGYSADNCVFDFTRSLHNFTVDDIYDHQYVMCDPNYKILNSEFKCFYEKYYFEHMFEYMSQFWRKYKSNRKFSLLLSNFAHRSSLEILKNMDNYIFEYFNNLFKDNLLKDTSIFLLSDHGLGIPSIYYLNEFFKYESHLPMLYLIINDRKNETYKSQYKYINQNQQSFITAFDIYDTIINIIYGNKFGTNEIIGIKSRHGQSLFTEINSKLRSPKNYTSMAKSVCK